MAARLPRTSCDNCDPVLDEQVLDIAVVPPNPESGLKCAHMPGLADDFGPCVSLHPLVSACPVDQIASKSPGVEPLRDIVHVLQVAAQNL